MHFEKCTFQNATHITLGASKAEGVGKVSFNDCNFNDGGCLGSGYTELSVTNSRVTAAKNGFANINRGSKTTIDNCVINAGRYLFRTNISGAVIAVNNSTITLYESEGTADLVNFRGGSTAATFTGCTLPATYITAGVGTYGTLTVN